MGGDFDYILIELENTLRKFQISRNGRVNRLRRLVSKSLINHGSYHLETTKHNGNKTTCACPANEIKVLARQWWFAIGCGASIFFHDPLNLVQESLDDKK